MRNKAKKALDDARRFADEGRYDEALEKHIWFHEHALDHDSSFYGVRLSFALSDWVELGQLYPKALAKLREIRDMKTALLELGDEDEELFHDVSAINRELGDHEETVTIFKILDVKREGFAASVHKDAFAALVIAKEFRLARKYLHDPVAMFEGARQMLDERHLPEDNEIVREAFAKYFIKDVSDLLAFLDATKEVAFGSIVRRKTQVALRRWGSDVHALLIEYPILREPFHG